MEKHGGLKFKVGQLAELKSFAEGYRGAWFRCKIRDIILKKNKIQLEYYDFDEEEISWENICAAPPFGRKSRNIKKQLMLRPHYPRTYKKNEMPHANSISEVCVVIDGTWKVGDKVDWYYDSSYWSARVIEVLSDDKVKIKLPMPPEGEGKEDEAHDALCKDLRPCLEWSQSKGWTLPTLEGKTSGGARLIFPSKQGMDQDLISVESPLNASSSTCISAEGYTEIQSSGPVDTVNCDDKVQREGVMGDLAEGHAKRQSSVPVNAVVCDEKVQSEDVKMDDDFVQGNAETQSSVPVNTVICEEKVQAEDQKMDDDFAEGDTERQISNLLDTVISEEKMQIEDVKINNEFMESSGSISSLRVEENKVADESGIHFSRDLNIMHEDTLEAAILDLEELANKIKWMQNLLNNGNPSSNDSGSWKFV